MKNLLRYSVNILPAALRSWIKYIPGVAAMQRWVVNSVISGESFVHTINAGPADGLRFEVTLPIDKAIWAGIYESEFAAAIVKGVREGDVCYDIGGYRGYMSGSMALYGASKVIVFEPLPTNQQALTRLCKLNPELPIELKPMAVGNLNGSIQLKVMADASMGKLVSSKFQDAAASVDEIQVEIRTIDSMVERGEIPPPNVIKIDVEGAELGVLSGATNVLKVCRPLIFLEAHSATLEEECTQMLSQYGYEVRRLESKVGGDEETRHLIALRG